MPIWVLCTEIWSIVLAIRAPLMTGRTLGSSLASMAKKKLRECCVDMETTVIVAMVVGKIAVIVNMPECSASQSNPGP